MCVAALLLRMQKSAEKVNINIIKTIPLEENDNLMRDKFSSAPKEFHSRFWFTGIQEDLSFRHSCNPKGNIVSSTGKS